MRIILLLIVLTYSSTTLARSCLAKYNIYRAENKLEALDQFTEFMFVGKAELVQLTTIQSEEHRSINEVIVSFEVEEPIKPKLSGKVRVKGHFSGGCECIYEFEPGKSYLVSGGIDKEEYVLKFCGLIKEITEAEIGAIREFTANKKRNEMDGSDEPPIR